MGSITWGAEMAEVYDMTYSAMFEPSVLDPMVTCSLDWREAARHSSSRSAPGGWRCR